jgi:eukaryotic-like serine/threonine-protein kinase
MTMSLPPVPDFGAGPTIITLNLDLGSEIGRGQGQNSQVFLGQDRQLQTQFAVKRIPKANLPPTYFDEARNLYYARHRNVVEVKYAGQTDEHVFLAMPFYRGGTLQTLIETRYLSTREIVRYGLDFLSGLHHVHVRRLIHFDVKPTNVLLDDSDTGTLSDFGLAREMDNTGQVLRWTVYGRHRPPEFTSSSRRVSRAADIYQAGLTLYRMCAGHLEFERQAAKHGADQEGNSVAIDSGAFPERQRFLSHIPMRLRRIISKALEVDPAQRYSSVLEMMNALALVDEALDWYYRQGAEWGEGVWNESSDSRNASTRSISLVRCGSAWDVAASRAFPDGRQRRFSRFCKSRLSQHAAQNLVQQAMTQIWN